MGTQLLQGKIQLLFDFCKGTLFQIIYSFLFKCFFNFPACRWRMLVRSFSATKDRTCKTISLNKVPKVFASSGIQQRHIHKSSYIQFLHSSQLYKHKKSSVPILPSGRIGTLLFRRIQFSFIIFTIHDSTDRYFHNAHLSFYTHAFCPVPGYPAQAFLQYAYLCNQNVSHNLYYR